MNTFTSLSAAGLPEAYDVDTVGEKPIPAVALPKGSGVCDPLSSS